MANQAVGTKLTVELDDGTVVTLKSLVISRLITFMEEWGKVEDIDSGDGEKAITKELFDIYIRCSAVALEKELKAKNLEDFKSTREDDDVDKDFSPEYLQYLKDVLDLETIFTVLRVCGGITIGEGDPKAE